MILTWRRWRGSPSTTPYTQTLHTHTPGSAAHLFVSACNTHKPSSSSVLKLSQTSPSRHSHVFDLQHGLLFAHVDRLQVSPLHRIVFLLPNRHLAAHALAIVAEVPQHSRSGDGQQQQREPRAWGHLTQETLSYCVISHLYRIHVLYCSLTFTQSEEEDVEQNAAQQGTQRHPPPENTKSWTLETQSSINNSETRLEQKQSLLMRVPVCWSTGRSSQCSRWLLRDVSHPSRERSTSSESVTGSRKMAIRLKQITMFSRSKVSALGLHRSELLSMENASLAGSWASSARSPLACVGSWGEEAAHCMLGNQRST